MKGMIDGERKLREREERKHEERELDELRREAHN